MAKQHRTRCVVDVLTTQPDDCDDDPMVVCEHAKFSVTLPQCTDVEIVRVNQIAQVSLEEVWDHDVWDIFLSAHPLLWRLCKRFYYGKE